MNFLIVVAALAAVCNAAPNEIRMEKGEEPLHPDHMTKGNQNSINKPVIDEQGELWIPFYSFFHGVFNKQSVQPKPTLSEPFNRPVREDFDTSDEYLMAENRFHFGSEESHESKKLVAVEGDEHKAAVHREPEHVRDAVLYNKVLPKREDFSDYGEYLEEFSKHIMEKPKDRKAAKNSWFSEWF